MIGKGSRRELFPLSRTRRVREYRSPGRSPRSLSCLNVRSQFLVSETALLHLVKTATLYDTAKAEVAKVTYKPPSFTPSLKGLIPRVPLEQDYLNVLYNSHRSPAYDNSAPFEVHLHRELSNPHSHAKKLARWKSYQFYKKELLTQYMDAELKNLNGRPQREARAEAAFKWRAKLEEEKQADRKRRWKHKAYEVNAERKNARKAKREVKQRQRLTQLVLRDEPNQVVPKDL